MEEVKRRTPSYQPTSDDICFQVAIIEVQIDKVLKLLGEDIEK